MVRECFSGQSKERVKVVRQCFGGQSKNNVSSTVIPGETENIAQRYTVTTTMTPALR